MPQDRPVLDLATVTLSDSLAKRCRRLRAGSAALVRRCAVLAAVLLVTLPGISGAAHAQVTVSARKSCRQVSVPVSADSGRGLGTVRGQLCVPGGTARPATVQVLVPGATYSDIYWDFPYEPQNYSYVNAMLASGYATLNVDPVGFGRSSHPLSALVSMDTEAYAIHRVVQAARDGAIGIRFPRVVVVSHSMGTAVAWREAAVYHDINGLIATGNSHHPSLPGTLRASADLYPAFVDPRFAHAGLDPGYLTTRPGTRAGAFYNTADADPGVIAFDEKTKDTVTAAYLATYFQEDFDGDTARINVPVLIALGQDDHIMCVGIGADDCSDSAALLRSETPYYGPGACLQAFVLPRAGHVLNLSLNARSFFSVAAHWTNRWIGAGSPAPKPHCDGPAGPIR